MKKFIIIFLALFVSLSFIFNGFSVDVDGVDSGDEWHDSAVYVLTDGESNCNINFGLVKVKLDNKNSAVFFCFMFKDPLLEQDNTDCGIKISVNDSTDFELYPVNNSLNKEIENYSFDGAIHIDENNGATCEVRIGFKEYLPETINCDVQFVDSFGEPSNHYYLAVINNEYSEPTSLIISPDYNGSDNGKATKVQTENTKTTKEKTEKSTTKRKYITSKPASTTEFVISESPMIYTGRTKAPKTTVEESTSFVNNGVTVYFYEKEVLISMVPFVVNTQLNIETISAEPVESSSIINSEINDSSVNATADKPVFSLSDGTEYKKISIILGSVAFLIIAVCSSIYLKKK